VGSSLPESLCPSLLPYSPLPTTVLTLNPPNRSFGPCNQARELGPRAYCGGSQMQKRDTEPEGKRETAMTIPSSHHLFLSSHPLSIVTTPSFSLSPIILFTLLVVPPTYDPQHYLPLLPLTVPYCQLRLTNKEICLSTIPALSVPYPIY
jgi:hypothetical protein